MFAHYLKIALRNLWKYKAQSLIGIFGLAFGVACFVPALYWMRYETTYDEHYPAAENIYRLYSVEKQSGKVDERVPPILDNKMREQFPGIEASADFILELDNYSAEGMPHIQLQTLMTDSAFFGVFQQEVISGDPQRPMQVPHNIVLTESVAARLFGDAEKAVGQHIRSTTFTWFPPYTVTAVVKDPPASTNVPFDVILFSEIQKDDDWPEAERWKNFSNYIYIKLNSHANAAEVAEQLRGMDGNADMEFRMLPIGDVRHRLNTDLPFTLNFVRLFVAAGILLLFCALFNFLNLYLDLFRERLRELRQRTVQGATEGQLIVQMMFELACILLLALALAACFIVLSYPAFARLLAIGMDLGPVMRLFAICGTGVMAATLLAGFVPFWRLSRSATQHLATGKSTRQPIMRRVAVSLQLAVSVVLLVATGVVTMQMRFVNHKDLGFDSDGIVQLTGGFTTMFLHGKAIKNELAALPQVENITGNYFEPQHSVGLFTNTEVEWPGKPVNEQPVFQTLDSDSRFAETFGLTMSAGNWWNEGDDRKIVLNEEAVRVMGLSDPIGTVIRMQPNIMGSPMQDYEVAGVVKDFHTLSLRSHIQPTIFRDVRDVSISVFYFRVAPGREQETIRQITELLPGIDESLADIRLTTLNEVYDRLNHSEQAGLELFSLLAAVCLLISLFGIYAVATGASQRRRKEIAIRKVYGADVDTIVRLFFSEYTMQVIFAGVVALPLAWFAMSRWLQGYAYRTNIPWWLLTGVIMAVVAVVLLTVWGQVQKAANGNPAEVVKSE